MFVHILPTRGSLSINLQDFILLLSIKREYFEDFGPFVCVRICFLLATCLSCSAVTSVVCYRQFATNFSVCSKCHDDKALKLITMLMFCDLLKELSTDHYL